MLTSKKSQMPRILLMLNVLSIVFFVMLLMISSVSTAPRTSAFSSSTRNLGRVISPTTQEISCANRANTVFLVLFSQKGPNRCLVQGQDSQEHLLNPFDSGVYRVCTHQRDAYISYDSYADPRILLTRSNSVIGTVGVLIQADTCETIRDAIGQDRMTVTSVWIAPWFGGGVDNSPDPQNLIHRVSGSQCTQRGDFFEIWYDFWSQKACYANAGLLRLSQPLANVVRICSGANTGEASFEQDGNLLTGMGIELGTMRICAGVAESIAETTSMTVTSVFISPLDK